MSDGHQYTDELRLFRETVSDLRKEFAEIRNEMRDGFKILNDKIDNVKAESDTLIEGIPKHGVRPLREEIDTVKEDVEKLKDFKSKLIWTASGVSAGVTVIFSIVKTVFGI